MKPLIALFLLAGSFTFTYGQACTPPTIVANAKSANFFTAEQEMIIGELTLQRLSGEFRQLRDPQILAYIEAIGAKLNKHLPQTGLQFKFYVIDYPSANAFNIPGGHVFVSRKLIAFSNSEDEVAGVIAHELGHASVHHGAQDLSTAMREVLNITSVGDRKDIIDKYNRLIENARTKRSSSRRGHENEQQLEADKIGFHAMVAAGYDPGASFTFFDRLTESEGKTGSWFSSIFGNVRPEQKRLREIAEATKKLPPNCRDQRAATPTEEFLRWQADVVGFRESDRAEVLPGLMWKKEISPKLRSDVSQIKFSNDGKLLLVVDDFAITVIEREGLKVLTQIPADDVSAAYFAADNKEVVFTTETLRFERWDVNGTKPKEVRELVLRRDCWEHELSPDGNYLACVDLSTNINVIETKTGKRIWEKKKFYELSFFEYLTWSGAGGSSERRASFFRIGFTPNSRSVVFSRSNKYRFRFRIDGMTVDQSENSAVGVDLTTLKPIDLGGDLKKVFARSFVFLDSERVLGNSAPKLEAGGIFAFPGGKRLQKLEFGAEEVGATADPNFVTIKPVTNATIGVYDLARASIVNAMNKTDVAVWKNLIAFESVSGKILVRETRFDEEKKGTEFKDIGSVDLPVGTISDMRTAEVSDEFSWLIMSSKTRGGLWNLKTGERAVFSRGFNGGIVDNKGTGVAAFPKFQSDKHSLVILSGGSGSGSQFKELPEYGAKQFGRFMLTRKSLKDDTSKKTDGPVQQFPLSDDEQAELKLRSDVSFELKDWIQDKVVWTREFKGAVPRYSFDSYSGRLLFYWRLASEEGKAKLKDDAALQAKAEALGNKAGDYLIEVIDGYDQKNVGNMLLETGQGSFFVSDGQSERDWLILNDSEDRILAYSLKDGTLRHRFFGSHAAINPTQEQLIVENFPGEVVLYSLETGDKVAEFSLKGKLAFARFSLDGKRLFLFSDSQNAYAIDLTKVKQQERPVIL